MQPQTLRVQSQRARLHLQSRTPPTALSPVVVARVLLLSHALARTQAALILDPVAPIMYYYVGLEAIQIIYIPLFLSLVIL